MDEAYADSLSTDFRWLGHSHFDSHPSAGDSIQLDSNEDDFDPSRVDRIGRIAELLDGLEEEQIHELVSGINDTAIQDKASANPDQGNTINYPSSPTKVNEQKSLRSVSNSQPPVEIFSNPSFPPPHHPVTFTSTPYKHVPAVSDTEPYNSQRFFDYRNANENENQNQKQFSFPSSHSTAISQTTQPCTVPSNPTAPSTQNFEASNANNQRPYQSGTSDEANQRSQQGSLHEQNAYSPLYSNYPKTHAQHLGVPINRGNVYVESVHDRQEPTATCPPTSSTCVSTISQPQPVVSSKLDPPVSQPANLHLHPSPPAPPAAAPPPSTLEVLPPALNEVLEKMNTTIQSLTNQCQQRDKQIDLLNKQLLFNNQQTAATVMPAIISDAPGAPNQRNMADSPNYYPRKPPAPKQTRSVTVGNDTPFPHTKPQGTVSNEVRVQLTTLDAILLQFDHLRKELSQARHEIQILKQDASQAKGISDEKSNHSTVNNSREQTSCANRPEHNDLCSHRDNPKSSILQPIEVPNGTLNKNVPSNVKSKKPKDVSPQPIAHTSKALSPQDMPDSKFNLPKENQLYYRLGLHLIDRQCSIETANMLKSVLIQLDMPYTIFPMAIGQVRRQLQQGRRLYQWIHVVHYLLFHEKMEEGLVSKQCLSNLLKKLQEKIRPHRK
ncbi:SIN component scaffold protein Sid4 [Schizosaccharomyces octosporus yFS286]|uniref:SIN component scaffold protein Sid4 n=1 Tax=Schizosaccharomyces octosporus (strain yFS286) TaxID=483514 RepID=S9PZL4_SCHOY|nr:SIN component scaffold protein Sid4 [Schizosaccharomyces octosporus yFS286]EPX72898.1 SIN component scaffold protein Sid4 [Schizosaccharomyces octosporus yFS286]